MFKYDAHIFFTTLYFQAQNIMYRIHIFPATYLWKIFRLFLFPRRNFSDHKKDAKT